MLGLRKAPAHTTVPAATLIQKLLIQLAISPSHNILTPGQPVPEVTPSRKAAARRALKSSVQARGRTPPADSPMATAGSNLALLLLGRSPYHKVNKAERERGQLS